MYDFLLELSLIIKYTHSHMKEKLPKVTPTVAAKVSA